MALPNSWVDVGVIFAKHRLCCHNLSDLGHFGRLGERWNRWWPMSDWLDIQVGGVAGPQRWLGQ